MLQETHNGIPKTMGVNTRLTSPYMKLWSLAGWNGFMTWMIWGTPILGNVHSYVLPDGDRWFLYNFTYWLIYLFSYLLCIQIITLW